MGNSPSSYAYARDGGYAEAHCEFQLFAKTEVQFLAGGTSIAIGRGSRAYSYNGGKAVATNGGLAIAR